MAESPKPLMLQAYLATARVDRSDPRVEAFREISAGWESDVYAFDLVSGPATARLSEPLVLRVYPGMDAYEKSSREFRALQRLHQAGYPVPRVLLLEQTTRPFGKPFLIMERVPGRVMWRETFHGPEEQQRTLFERFVRLLVDLHALDWQLFVDTGEDSACAGATGWIDDPYLFADGYISLLHEYMGRFHQPGFLPVVEWLEARRDRVPCERPAAVHWDYHPANLLVHDNGRATVIDWTQFEVTDPRLDLAWTLTLLGSQEGDNVRARILETYEDLSGSRVKELAFFEVLACVKRLASVTISLAVGAEALGMRAGAEAMMRDHLPTLRRVYDRLQALTGLTVPEVDALYSETLCTQRPSERRHLFQQ